MLFLILNLTSSTGVAPYEFMGLFFKIGLGLPMHQGAVGSRHILFGSYNKLPRNIGILFAWLGFFFICMGLLVKKIKKEVAAAKRMEGNVSGGGKEVEAA